jgi:hypothetical protein
MSEFMSKPATAFAGQRRLCAGPLVEVALAVKAALDAGEGAPLLTFDDSTGAVVDLDLRGAKADVIARLSERGGPEAGAVAVRSGPRGRGRPRLGVVAREVTLLPRHWEWLAAQPGGASVALRRLVEAARRDNAGPGQIRVRRDAAYRFMSAMAGDQPGFEEASRALFAGDPERLRREMAAWPQDLRDHALKLAWGPERDVAE